MQFIKKYQWLLPQLSFTMLMFAGRWVRTQNLTFAFIGWNLFLALIPLYFSYKASELRSKWMQYACMLTWLAFFPNSIYIVTDLMHLAQRSDMPLWYDLLLLFSAALNGVVFGFLSLHNVEQWLQLQPYRKLSRPIIFLLLLGCGFGIYLGRYQRWNSWDVIADPWALASDIARHILHPIRYIQCWMVSLFFGWWMFVAYHFFRNMRTIK